MGVNKAIKASGDNGGNFYNDNIVHPENIGEVLKLIRDMYKLNIPIYVTENGLAASGIEHSEADGMIHDDARIAYMEKALESIDLLLAEGIDVRGYYVWSLMDTFEWSAGFNGKYGLQHTNFETMERTWKKSAYWYRDFIRKARGNI